MEENKNQTPEVPKWIQTRSWEVELLISGGAIISLLQFYDYLYIQIDKIHAVTFFQIQGFSYALISIRLLAVFFSVHLVTRAYWLALVFLNKLFPDGIDLRSSNLVEPYLTINKRFDLVKQINVIDTFCSLIFCWSFTSALIFIGTSTAVTLLSLPASLHSVFPKFYFQIVVLPLIISFFIFLFDLFTFGMLRKNRASAKIFLPIYWFWNKVSLGFIWRPNVELMFSKIKSKWTVSVIVVLIISVSFYLPKVFANYLSIVDQRKHSLSEILVDESMYMDKYSPEQWQEVSIQSDLITDNCIKIFIPYTIGDDGIVDSVKEGSFSNIIKVSINDSSYSKLQWVGINKMNRQKGIQTVINIAHLKSMMHLLKIEERNDDHPVLIPFWKQ